MRVIATACGRGGVGKTSWTLALAEVAAAAGLRTFVVDLDPHATASRRLLGRHEREVDGPLAFEGRSTLDVLLRRQRGGAAHAAVASAAAWPEDLLLVPSPGATLAGFETTRVADQDRRLARALAGLDQQGVDLVLIDTPPLQGLLTQNGLVAADEVVLVAHVVGSRQAVAGTHATIEQLATDGGVRTAGLVLTDVGSPRSRSRAAREALELWREEWDGRILAELPSSSVWVTAEQEAKPLAAYLSEPGRSLPARTALDLVATAAARLGLIPASPHPDTDTSAESAEPARS